MEFVMPIILVAVMRDLNQRKTENFVLSSVRMDFERLTVFVNLFVQGEILRKLFNFFFLKLILFKFSQGAENSIIKINL